MRAWRIREFLKDAATLEKTFRIIGRDGFIGALETLVNTHQGRYIEVLLVGVGFLPSDPANKVDVFHPYATPTDLFKIFRSSIMHDYVVSLCRCEQKTEDWIDLVRNGGEPVKLGTKISFNLSFSLRKKASRLKRQTTP